jgi:hypothetical protein
VWDGDRPKRRDLFVAPTADPIPLPIQAVKRATAPQARTPKMLGGMLREGWILSQSSWRDEKSVVRWRTAQNHHLVQKKGGDDILECYHLRVGEIFADNKLPAGMELLNQRNDETEVGEGTMVTIITATRPPGHPSNVVACSQFLGLDIYSGDALVDWDVYDAVLNPGDLCLMLIWKDCSAVEYFEDGERMLLPATHRVRHVRVVRDYTMRDRREAPQYFGAVDHTTDPHKS